VPSADITYLLGCRVLLEKLTGLQLVKKFPAFDGIRRFITALTSVRHLSLSWASPIQSIYPHPTSWRSILIFLSTFPVGSNDYCRPLVLYLNINAADPSEVFEYRRVYVNSKCLPDGYNAGVRIFSPKSCGHLKITGARKMT